MRLPNGKSVLTIIFILLGIIGSQQVSNAVDAKMATAGIREYFPEQPAVPNLEFERLETLPLLEGASEWMNGERDREWYFQDKPVLVQFWSYACIQCQDDLAYMKKWYSTYRKYGLEVVSIHSPSYISEYRLDRVKQAVTDMGIKYPVAFDQNFVIWHKFYNRFWPTTYLFDKDHNLIHTQVGTGGYEETEQKILDLFDLEPEDVVQQPEEEEIRTYIPLGHYKQRWYGGPEKIVKTGSAYYTFPESLAIERWALEGEWEFTDLSASLVSDEGRFRVHVFEPDVSISISVKDFRQTNVLVYLDGEFVPKENAGADLQIDVSKNNASFVTIEALKHFELFKGLVGPHVIELRFDHPGMTVHSVSFPLRLEE